MIVVFDADIFENQQNNYEDIIALGKKNNILWVTNPSFELFLLLHYKGTVDEIILPDSANIIKNEWVGNGRNKRRYINNNIELCKGVITSNIGTIIQTIIDDQCND